MRLTTTSYLLFERICRFLAWISAVCAVVLILGAALVYYGMMDRSQLGGWFVNGFTYGAICLVIGVALVFLPRAIPLRWFERR